VEHDANINKTNELGETVLFVACKNRIKIVVKCLVELGADINKANKDGITPLSILHYRNQKIRQ